MTRLYRPTASRDIFYSANDYSSTSCILLVHHTLDITTIPHFTFFFETFNIQHNLSPKGRTRGTEVVKSLWRLPARAYSARSRIKTRYPRAIASMRRTIILHNLPCSTSYSSCLTIRHGVVSRRWASAYRAFHHCPSFITSKSLLTSLCKPPSPASHTHLVLSPHLQDYLYLSTPTTSPCPRQSPHKLPSSPSRNSTSFRPTPPQPIPLSASSPRPPW